VLRLVEQVGRGDAQGQGEEPAGLSHLRGRLGLGRDPFLPQDAGQQHDRLVGCQNVQAQPVGAVGGHQSGQPVAARHQDQATLGTWQQGADLLGVASVV
jgi:hypothetical protein